MASHTTARARLLLGAAAIAGTLTAATPVFAGAFYLQEQSVKGAGRAFSGEVADTGAESLWWNPAAIGGVASSAYLGATGIVPTGHVVNGGTELLLPSLTGGAPTPAPVGGSGNIHNPINKGVLPAGGVGWRLSDKLSVGIAVTSPFSFTTNYPADSWTRYEADKTRLRTIDLQPTIAFAPAPWLSIGGGVNVEHADATLSNALPNFPVPTTSAGGETEDALAAAAATGPTGEPDGEQTLKGRGWDLGWSAGAQVRTMDGALTIGASYKSSIKHDLSGTVTVAGLTGLLVGNNFSAHTHASFRTPWQAIVGARFKVAPALTLNAQVVRLGWNKFDAINLGDPVDESVPEDYRNTWSFAGGVDYDVTSSWTLRAGVQHDESPTRNGARDARVPDSNRMNYAAGTSLKLGGGFTIDASVSYIDFKNAPIDRPDEVYLGTPLATPILVAGELHNAHAWTFGLGGRLTF